MIAHPQEFFITHMQFFAEIDRSALGAPSVLQCTALGSPPACDTWLRRASLEVCSDSVMPPVARSMCLFLQNQDFQLHAEYMLGSLYDGGKEAASRLLLVNASLSQQVDRLP